MNQQMSSALAQEDNTPVVLVGSDSNGVRITSVELVELINQFRVEEGNTTEKQHNDLMKSIRKEIETLQSVGIGQGNFSLTSYIDSQNKSQPCYSMNKYGALQMLNKESTIVRYKTTQYIEKLEEQLRNKPISIEDAIIESMKLQKELKEQLNQVNCHALEAKAQSQEVKQEIEDMKDSMPLFKIECDDLVSMVKKKATHILGGYKSNAYNDKSILQRVYKDIYAQINREFGVEKCSGIKRKDFDIAKQFVEDYKAPMVLVQDINLANSQTTLFDKKEEKGA